MIKRKLNLTKGTKIAAYYFIFVGVTNFLLLFFATGIEPAEFQEKSMGYQLGIFFRESLINILFIISGVGLLKKKVWARKLSLTLLVISTLFTAIAFAWGFAGKQPQLLVIIFSIIIMIWWNSLWFYLIYRSKITKTEISDDAISERNDNNNQSFNDLNPSVADNRISLRVKMIRKSEKLKQQWFFRAIGLFVFSFFIMQITFTVLKSSEKSGVFVLFIAGIAISLLFIYYSYSPIIKLNNGLMEIERPFSTSFKIKLSDIQRHESFFEDYVPPTKNEFWKNLKMRVNQILGDIDRNVENNRVECLKIHINNQTPFLIRSSAIHEEDWGKLKELLTEKEKNCTSSS